MPEATPTLGSRAVFLSYSREDTEAARRTADALRPAGIEVWFDKEGGLEHGDEWDAKIRRQIKECLFFLPLISANTQARLEGYFRIEWELAAERAMGIVQGVPFILPIIIDDTPEDDMLVPERFRKVQWTRLPHGEPTPEFVSHVKRLVEEPRQAQPAASNHAPVAPFIPRKARLPGWVWGVLGVAAVALGGLLFFVVAKRPGGAPTAEAQLPAVAATGPVGVPPNEKSIAVLPFENMCEDKDANAFFADGVHDDILTNLSYIKELRVVSRTSVMQYRNTTKSISQIARELGVAYLLEGSVRRAGKKVRVSGQLIRAATDEHVWAKVYDRDLTDIFAIQTELAQAIARALQTALTPAEGKSIARRPTKVTAAYDLYLRARQGAYSDSLSIDTCLDCLLEAVQLDPNFAQAWALIGSFQAGKYFYDQDSSAARMAKAKAAIEMAVRLAPDDPEVIKYQGDYYYRGFRDYASAAERYRRVLDLQPNSAETVGSLGLIYRRQGHWAEAQEYLRKGVELDPKNLSYKEQLALNLSLLRHYKEAEAEWQNVVNSPDCSIFWKFDAVRMLHFRTRGSTAETDTFFASMKPGPDEKAMATELKRQWAREKGDYAEAIRIDERQPYFDGFGTPRWSQDFTVATDHIGAGNLNGARERLTRLLPVLKMQLDNEASNAELWAQIGWTEAYIGDRDGALIAERKLAELLPESADAVHGPGVSLDRAHILALIGEKGRAFAELARLLRVPSGANVYDERNDPSWMRVRDDPRFEALLSDPKNNAPL